MSRTLFVQHLTNPQLLAVVFETDEPHALLLRLFGAVERQVQFAVQALENHAVPAVLAVQDLVLRPWPGEPPFRGRPDQHAIPMPLDEVRPDEIEPSALLRAIQETAVRHARGPLHCRTGVQQPARRGRKRGEVVRQRRVLDRSVRELAPFVAVDHVGAAALHMQRPVERHQLARRHGAVLDGAERPARRVRPKDPRSAWRQVLRVGIRRERHHAEGVRALGQRHEQPIRPVVAVDFRRPDGCAVHLRRQRQDGRRLRPAFKVGAFAHRDAASAEPGLRLVEVIAPAVHKDERVADAEVRAPHAGRGGRRGAEGLGRENGQDSEEASHHGIRLS